MGIFADRKERDARHKKALHAIEHNVDPIIFAQMIAGLDVDRQCPGSGATFLTHALCRERPALVKVLRKAGASLDVPNSMDRLPREILADKVAMAANNALFAHDGEAGRARIAALSEALYSTGGDNPSPVQIKEGTTMTEEVRHSNGLALFVGLGVGLLLGGKPGKAQSQPPIANIAAVVLLEDGTTFKQVMAPVFVPSIAVCTKLGETLSNDFHTNTTTSCIGSEGAHVAVQHCVVLEAGAPASCALVEPVAKHTKPITKPAP